MLRLKKEEHYTMVAQLGDMYVTNFSPNSSSAAEISNQWIKITKNYSCNLVALGSDGTATNTGRNGGIRLVELHLCHPVNWFICMLDINELPLRHLFVALDGKHRVPIRLLDQLENLYLARFIY